MKKDHQPPTAAGSPPPPSVVARRRRGGQRARKRCAFFTMLITRTGHSGEPATVKLSADIKLFHYTAHVCGLRDVRDARLVMRYIHNAFTGLQVQLDADTGNELAEAFSEGNRDRATFITENRACCSIPLTVSEGDVVMTNLCGRFPQGLNLRATFTAISEQYPGVYTYLTTMSKSNYLVVILFEHEPVRVRGEMTEEQIQKSQQDRISYLMSSKRLRSRYRKHTFFIYASGRFIQSSRNNATALDYTRECMKLLSSVSSQVPEVLALTGGGGSTQEDNDEEGRSRLSSEDEDDSDDEAI